MSIEIANQFGTFGIPHNEVELLISLEHNCRQKKIKPTFDNVS